MAHCEINKTQYKAYTKLNGNKTNLKCSVSMTKVSHSY